MIIASASQFHVYLQWVNASLALCLNRVLNVKAVVGAFNQEKALVGAFSVITNLRLRTHQLQAGAEHAAPPSNCPAAVHRAMPPPRGEKHKLGNDLHGWSRFSFSFLTFSPKYETASNAMTFNISTTCVCFEMG